MLNQVLFSAPLCRNTLNFAAYLSKRMINRLISYSKSKQGLPLFLALAACFLVLGGVALVTEQIIIALTSFGLLVAVLAIFDFRAIYLMLWASIPLSTELYFSSGVGMDFPDELLMIAVTGILFIYVLMNLSKVNLGIIFHPIFIALLLHISWIWVTAIQSDIPLVSIKFGIAKTWFIGSFFLMTLLLFRHKSMYKAWFLSLFSTLLLTMIIILFRHAGETFSFESINSMVVPFYRNHVNYACIIVVTLPFLFLSRKFMPGTFSKTAWIALLVFTLIALYFTYTRAAYLAVFVGIGGYLIIRFKLILWSILGALIVAGLFLNTMAKDNKYIDFAPEYHKTITHYKFDNLIEATYNFEDISTMERFYRWIAGIYMLEHKPVFGFGPGNFYNYYKSYTDENFVTYVSDNPEKSGTHNYYIMTAADQGIPGLIFFLILCTVTLLTGQRLWHRLADERMKYFSLACSLCILIILFIQLFNDLVEVDKIGSFFFFSMAGLLVIDYQRQKNLSSPDEV